MPVQITPFTTSPSRTNPATFSVDMDTRLSQENSRIVEMNLQSDENNAINVNVNAKEASATLSASTAITASDLALANANFKGVWNSASSYAVPSSVYYNGEYFIALSPSSNQTPNPLAATTYWAPYSIAFQITNSTIKTTPVDADVFGFLDSAAAMILKKLTWANIKAAMKTYTDTLYVALTGAQTVAGVKTFSSNPLSSAVQDTAITALTRKDYVDTALGLKAPLASPALTGIPTGPTAAAGTNTTQLATTEYVDSKMVLGTSVPSTSGTSINFANIPSFAKRITITLNGVSTSGASFLILQIGSLNTIETSGYISSSSSITTVVGTISQTIGFAIMNGSANTYVLNGEITLSLSDSILKKWCASSIISMTSGTTGVCVGGGSKEISGDIGIVRITTVNGTDTFDAGSINISWEF